MTKPRAVTLPIIFLALALSPPGEASTPASSDVTVPLNAGETVVVEWTGTALAGTSGSANMCPPEGPDDFHTVNLEVPDGLYDELTVTASFHIEWDIGEPAAGGLFTDPDLVLSVYRGAFSEGDSDGGSPEENVTLTNPDAGTLRAIACPFAASNTTEYRGRLTLTASGEASCVTAGSAKAHALDSGSSLQIDPEARGLPNIDRFRDQHRGVASAVPTTPFPGRHQSPLFDRQLDRPTFLWARRDAQSAAVGPRATESQRLEALARNHLLAEAKLLKLSPAMIEQARVFDAQYNGAGPAVVRFRQQFNGVEVFQRSLNVLIDRNDRPVAVSGYFADTAADAPTVHAGLGVNAPQAIAAAWAHFGGSVNAALLAPERQQADWTWYSAPVLSGSHQFERNPRVRPVWYAGADGLQAAWHLELFATARANGQLMAYGLVVAAADGAILHRKNLSADAAYSYRVFANDTGEVQPDDSPLGNSYTPFTGTLPTDEIVRISGNTRVVTIEAGPISTGDPWLPEGATTTVGNNTEACIDNFDNPASGLISNPANTCDPELGDMYGEINGPNSFDYDLVADTDPSTEEAQQAAVVNLFYNVSWQHDWWYDHGFNEAAGNAQSDNYGRGGSDGDPIRAQGQDASGRNNANMATPGDGSSPTMQQYLFDGPVTGEVRQLTPVDGEPLTFTGAGFGPNEFDETGAVELADDGAGVASNDGCGEDLAGQATAPAPTQSSLAGKIALIQRGNCNFTSKAQFALASGAIAMVVYNNADGEPITMGNGDIPVNAGASPTDAIYQIPSVMIRKADGEAIAEQLAAAEVTMHVQREPSIDLDGTVDNQIVAHEFYHYVHHRLTDSSNNQARAMSEGWGDINGFMLGARESDTQLVGNQQWQGAYPLAAYVTNSFYYGIRRAPYSTDFKKNAFTLKHLANGEPTPDGGPGTSNAAVHSSGEIWANQVWECYANLLNDPRYNFAQARTRMKDYIIGGLKMTPADATYTEARDAVLSVVLATDFGDYANCSAGFAKRGSGLHAVSPARSSADHVGVVEDYTSFVCGKSVGGGASLAPSTKYGGLGGATLLVLSLLAGLRRARRQT